MEEDEGDDEEADEEEDEQVEGHGQFGHAHAPVAVELICHFFGELF